jgi:4'-phosphopantetheinyl transferase EntD
MRDGDGPEAETAAQAAEALIAGLFTRPVSAAVARPYMYALAPLPEEAAAVARAVEKRRREFAAGRACARQALAALGAPPQALPVGPARAPIWPAGFIGSISHCDGVCCAVAARTAAMAGLGLDVEDAGPLPEGSARIVLRAEEARAQESLAATPGLDWAKLAFSAKEAAYKACQPLLGGRLGFLDAAVSFAGDHAFEIWIDPAALAPGAAAPRIAGRWRLWRGRVWTGATIAAV